MRTQGEIKDIYTDGMLYELDFDSRFTGHDSTQGDINAAHIKALWNASEGMSTERAVKILSLAEACKSRN
jgi:hypothetical protein